MIEFPPCYVLQRFFFGLWGLLPGDAAGGGMWQRLEMNVNRNLGDCRAGILGSLLHFMDTCSCYDVLCVCVSYICFLVKSFLVSVVEFCVKKAT